MNREAMQKTMEAVFEECRALRGAGQKEYAHRDENAFANFERIAERLGSPHSRESVLLTYMEKHLDGIHFCLLRGMVDEGREAKARLLGAPDPVAPK